MNKFLLASSMLLMASCITAMLKQQKTIRELSKKASLGDTAYVAYRMTMDDVRKITTIYQKYYKQYIFVNSVLELDSEGVKSARVTMVEPNRVEITGDTPAAVKMMGEYLMRLQSPCVLMNEKGKIEKEMHPGDTINVIVGTVKNL